MNVKSRAPHVPGELLIRLRPGQEFAPQDQGALTELGEVVNRFPLGGVAPESDSFTSSEILHLRLSPEHADDLESAISELGKDPRVQYAVTNDLLQELSSVEQPRKEEKRPNDLHPNLYGMEKISAPQAWAEQTGDRQKAPLIAVIDSGIDYRHPDLQANLWTNPNETANGKDDDGNGIVDDIYGFNAAAKTGDPMDDSGHGTHVAGTVAAVGNNNVGVVGVAWEAQMMALKFLAGGMGDMASAIAAITYADAQGARITQNSWGGPAYNQALVDTLAASPALHICAAGNSSNDSDVKPLYPAAYPLDNIVSVAATDAEDQLAKFSNFGATSVDLAAPGVKIYSTVIDEGYDFKSGTSMAAPHASGAASLILTKFPELTNEQLKDRLLFSTDRLPQLEGKTVSGGRLNLARALEDDAVAPGTPSALRATKADADLVALAWRASGDDGDEGVASAYELAVSEEPITEENFSQHRQIRTGPPGEPGTEESVSFDLTPSSRERKLNVALRAVDNVGNRSALKVLEVLVPSAHVAFEDGPDNWTAEGDWGREVEPGRGPVWSDSPGAFYKRDQNAGLTSKPFSLAGFESAQLQFDCAYDLEINFDKVHLEVRSGQDQEGAWKALESFNLLDGWHTRKFDLSDLAGSDQVQIRFRLVTDGDVEKEGFRFDRLVITGEPSAKAE